MPKAKIPKPSSYRKSPSGQKVPVWAGDAAVQMLELTENITLTPVQERVVREEGYSLHVYLDSKGIPTRGAGQTRQWINKPFLEAYEGEVLKAKGLTPGFDTYPEYLQDEIIQSTYRGDWGLSKDTRKYLEQGLYRQAATEFLDHDEYKKPSTSSGIKDRIRSVSDAITRYADEIDAWWMQEDPAF
jgi:hypothetical protein